MAHFQLSQLSLVALPLESPGIFFVLQQIPQFFIFLVVPTVENSQLVNQLIFLHKHFLNSFIKIALMLAYPCNLLILLVIFYTLLQQLFLILYLQNTLFLPVDSFLVLSPGFVLLHLNRLHSYQQVCQPGIQVVKMRYIFIILGRVGLEVPVNRLLYGLSLIQGVLSAQTIVIDVFLEFGDFLLQGYALLIFLLHISLQILNLLMQQFHAVIAFLYSFGGDLMSLCLIPKLPDSDFPKLLIVFVLLQSLPVDTIFFQQHLLSFLFIEKVILEDTNIGHQLVQLLID